MVKRLLFVLLISFTSLYAEIYILEQLNQEDTKTEENILQDKIHSLIGDDAYARHKEFIKITSIEELDALLAKNKGKKIILDFYADWCTACKELEEVTFSNTDVKSKMDSFILIQADVTANTEIEKALSDKFGVFGPPTLIFFDENSQVMGAKTIIGFIEPEPFLKHLNSL